MSSHCASVPLWKRVLDICGVLVAIPTLLPAMILIAIVIKVGSKGPVLFMQQRVGLGGKSFVIFKFRTMTAGAPTAVHETHAAMLIDSDKPMTKLDAQGDPRLIPFGRMLRAAGLDELPQLINVLRGEMSFVGPRPCVPAEYKRHLPWQMERFNTPPGLTGLWQVSGKNRLTFTKMIELDIEYVRNRSLWLDLKIILRTIPAVLAEIRDIQSLRRQPASRSAGQTSGVACQGVAGHERGRQKPLLDITQQGLATNAAIRHEECATASRREKSHSVQMAMRNLGEI